jgi:hypothetical protein
MMRLVTRIVIVYIINDLHNVYMKTITTVDVGGFFRGHSTEYSKLWSRYLVQIIIANIVDYLLFWDIRISGYYKTFYFFKHCFLLLMSLKTVFNFYPLKFFDEISNLCKNFILCNMLIIGLIDPLVNTDLRPNRLSLSEAYTRFLESEILLLVYYIISREAFSSGQDEEMNRGSLIYVIGEYDCFRYSAFLMICHYLFVLVNGFAFSFK